MVPTYVFFIRINLLRFFFWDPFAMIKLKITFEIQKLHLNPLTNFMEVFFLIKEVFRRS